LAALAVGASRGILSKTNRSLGERPRPNLSICYEKEELGD